MSNKKVFKLWRNGFTYGLKYKGVACIYDLCAVTSDIGQHNKMSRLIFNKLKEITEDDIKEAGIDINI